jgi:hypothetical protein
MTRKLYKVKMAGGFVAHCVATDPTTAYNMMLALYEKNDWSFPERRKLSEIIQVADEHVYSQNLLLLQEVTHE